MPSATLNLSLTSSKKKTLDELFDIEEKNRIDKLKLPSAKFYELKEISGYFIYHMAKEVASYLAVAKQNIRTRTSQEPNFPKTLANVYKINEDDRILNYLSILKIASNFNTSDYFLATKFYQKLDDFLSLSNSNLNDKNIVLQFYLNTPSTHKFYISNYIKAALLLHNSNKTKEAIFVTDQIIEKLSPFKKPEYKQTLPTSPNEAIRKPDQL